MSKVKAKDLRSLSVDELSEKAAGFRKELFQLRLDAKVGKVDNLLKSKQIRRDLARTLTVKSEMERAKNG